MNTKQAIALMTFLVLKHFLVDFVLQKPRHYKNKGFYGRWGGIEHAGTHALFTLSVIYPAASMGSAWLLALADGVLHYHIDWAKVNVNERMGWTPITSESYWILLGIDQTLHMLTYLGILWVIVLLE